MKLRVRDRGTPEVYGNRPLYERVPSCDEQGRPLSDFMVLIPGLRDLPATEFNDRVAGIHAVLGGHAGVVFADLNVPINLLWVSIRAELGLISRINADLKRRIPEALLVAPDRG